jgi:predicted nucleotide-binding protein
MFYHVRITQKSSKSHDEVKVDMTEEQLHSRIVEPYEVGASIFINGKTITKDDISRIRISRSNENSSTIIQRIKYEDRNSSVVFIGGPSYEWQAADRAEDITDEILQGPPGYKATKLEMSSKTIKIEDQVSSSKSKVFIVHGHDGALKNDLEVFLRGINLEPIVLHRQPDEGLTIIEKFERYSDVKFAFILLTPDDAAINADELKIPDEKRDWELRARQNVLFEFGYFIGKLGRSNVCCIYKEGVALPSDVSGLLYKEVTVSIEEIGFSLIKELKNVGIDVTL